MKSLILNFFLGVLKILFGFNPVVGHKNGGFFEILLERSLKFVSSKRDGTVLFNLSLILLSAEVDFIPEKWNYKGNILGVYGTGHIKIVLILLAEVVIFYIWAMIAQVGVLGLEHSITSCKVSLAMFIAFNE